MYRDHGVNVEKQPDRRIQGLKVGKVQGAAEPVQKESVLHASMFSEQDGRRHSGAEFIPGTDQGLATDGALMREAVDGLECRVQLVTVVVRRGRAFVEAQVSEQVRKLGVDHPLLGDGLKRRAVTRGQHVLFGQKIMFHIHYVYPSTV